MGNSNITTITNNLADGYKQLAKGTFQEASEIQNQRRINVDLREILLYTANLFLFRIRKGYLEYGLSGRKAFDVIAGEDIDEFTRQILVNEIYALTKQQNKKLEEELADDIAWAKAANLGLIEKHDEWSYPLIDTLDVNADKLNKYQKPFAAKVHGSMKAKYDPEQELPDYGENMNMLKKEGSIQQTRLWLPTPDHIGQYLKKDGAVVVRTSRLYEFDDGSRFSAGICNVLSHDALCGVPVKVAEGDAPIKAGLK